MIDRRPPSGYAKPHGFSIYTHFYLAPQADHDGAEPLFSVMKYDRGSERILAERCLRDDGIAIVDALRLSYGLATWGTA